MKKIYLGLSVSLILVGGVVSTTLYQHNQEVKMEKTVSSEKSKLNKINNNFKVSDFSKSDKEITYVKNMKVENNVSSLKTKVISNMNKKFNSSINDKLSLISKTDFKDETSLNKAYNDFDNEIKNLKNVNVKKFLKLSSDNKTSSLKVLNDNKKKQEIKSKEDSEKLASQNNTDSSQTTTNNDSQTYQAPSVASQPSAPAYQAPASSNQTYQAPASSNQTYQAPSNTQTYQAPAYSQPTTPSYQAPSNNSSNNSSNNRSGEFNGHNATVSGNDNSGYDFNIDGDSTNIGGAYDVFTGQ